VHFSHLNEFVFSCSVTYYAEFLPLKSRGICLVLIEFWWAVGSMFGALLALGVMNSLGWHWYLGIATIPLFLVLFIFPFVPESARFYLMKKKHGKVKSVLKKIAWFNKRPLPQGEVVSVEEKEKHLEATLWATVQDTWNGRIILMGK
jgi:MFS family permease